MAAPIQTRKPEEELYTMLQTKSLEYVQRVSGNIWTDYNPGDPGVTILDLLNYVLWELDYQLSFSIEDYLTAPSGHFKPDRHGLFGPMDVFPVSPVTPDDYRKLIFDAFDDIENVQISAWVPGEKEMNTCSGLYDLKIQINFWSDNSIRQNYLKNMIRRLFHQNRNLCESLHDIEFVDWKKLKIQATLDIEPGTDAALILSSVYIEASKLYAGGMRYRNLENTEENSEPIESLLEGPLLNFRAIDETSMSATVPVSVRAQLYNRIKKLPGVKAVRSLILPDYDSGFDVAVQFPKKKSEVEIDLLNEGKKVRFSFEEVARLLYLYRTSLYGDHNRSSGLPGYYDSPSSTYRDIYSYYSVQNEFPHCYGINTWGVSPDETVRRKAQTRQLKGYMLLFDLLFAKGLKEVKELREWMSLTTELPADRIPVLDDPLLQWNVLVDEKIREKTEEKRDHRLKAEKMKWLDVLDKLYGEQSNPAFLDQFDYYSDSEEEKITRRINFLSHIPDWGRNRFKGINIYDTSPAGRSGMEIYLSSLLGFGGVYGHPVTNLFISYNLRVLDDRVFFKKLGWLLEHNLILHNLNEMISSKILHEIPFIAHNWSDKEYDWLRYKLPVLERGYIFESFLREGIRIGNYYYLYIRSSDSYQLLFHYGTDPKLYSLGRFATRDELIRVVNLLCSFLLMLNKKSETLYIVEHVLLMPLKEESGEQNREGADHEAGIDQEEDIEDEEESEEEETDDEDSESLAGESIVPEAERFPLDFSLTVIVTGSTVRTSDQMFRKSVESLIRDRMPVHLDASVLWLSAAEISVFERLYYAWREVLPSGSGRIINKASGMLAAYLIKIRKVQ